MARNGKRVLSDLLDFFIWKQMHIIHRTKVPQFLYLKGRVRNQNEIYCVRKIIDDASIITKKKRPKLHLLFFHHCYKIIKIMVDFFIIHWTCFIEVGRWHHPLDVKCHKCFYFFKEVVILYKKSDFYHPV